MFGPVSGPTGYEEVTRNVLFHLACRGHTIALNNFKNWSQTRIQLSPEMFTCINLCLEQKLYPQTKPVVYLQVCLPEQVELDPHTVNINYTMFETDRIPELWVEASKKVDVTILPTRACMEAWKVSGACPEKLRKIPLGTDPLCFNPNVDSLELTDRKKGFKLAERFPIRIMVVHEVSERKNLWGALLAIMTLADQVGRENVCGLLKLSTYSHSIDFQSELYKFKTKLLETGILKGKPEEYHIYNYPQILPDGEFAQFLACGTHYFSLSLGEGWDLNALNCMAMMIPVIVPEHTGYLEYCSNETAWTIPVVAKAASTQEGATKRLYAGSNWFLPDFDTAIRIMKLAVEDKKEAQLKASAAYANVLQKFTWEKVTDQLEKVLLEYES